MFFFVHARQTFLKTHSAKKKGRDSRSFRYRALYISVFLSISHSLAPSLSLCARCLRCSWETHKFCNFFIAANLYDMAGTGRHEARGDTRVTSARTCANTKQIMCCILCGTRSPRGATQKCFMAKSKTKNPKPSRKIKNKWKSAWQKIYI